MLTDRRIGIYVQLTAYARSLWPREKDYIGEVIGGDDFSTRVKWYDQNRVFVDYLDISNNLLEPCNTEE